MYVTVLDVRGTHVNNPDCPMRIAQTPRGGWVCLDCGFEILQKRVNYHQFTETVRGVLKMLEVVDDPHGVVHRARELLKIELREVGVLHDDRHILNMPFYDGLEPDALAERMGAKRKACHGRPPITVPEREHVAGVGSDPHEGGTRE
jgi:hypothetical protein